jgi:hypothetical protein
VGGGDGGCFCPKPSLPAYRRFWYVGVMGGGWAGWRVVRREQSMGEHVEVKVGTSIGEGMVAAP